MSARPPPCLLLHDPWQARALVRQVSHIAKPTSLSLTKTLDAPAQTQVFLVNCADFFALWLNFPKLPEEPANSLFGEPLCLAQGIKSTSASC